MRLWICLVFACQSEVIHPPDAASLPSCVEIGCVAVSCGNLTPEGDRDPHTCSCWLADGAFTSCHLEQTR